MTILNEVSTICCTSNLTKMTPHSSYSITGISAVTYTILLLSMDKSSAFRKYYFNGDQFHCTGILNVRSFPLVDILRRRSIVDIATPRQKEAF